MKTRVAIYCRIAEGNQQTLDFQKIQLQDYINAHVDWCKGEIYSDIMPANRLAENSDLNRLLSDAEKGNFQRVVVLSMSRLAREPEQLFQIINRLRASGVDIDFVKEGVSASQMIYADLRRENERASIQEMAWRM